MKRVLRSALAGVALAGASGCAVFICSPGSSLTTAMPLTGVNNHGTVAQPIMPGASSNGVDTDSESTGGLGGGGSDGGGGGSVTTPAMAKAPADAAAGTNGVPTAAETPTAVGKR